MVQHILLYSHEMNSTGQLYNNFCPNEFDFFPVGYFQFRIVVQCNVYNYCKTFHNDNVCLCTKYDNCLEDESKLITNKKERHHTQLCLSLPPVGVGRVQRSLEFLVSKQFHTSIKSKTFQIVYNDLNKCISHFKK